MQLPLCFYVFLVINYVCFPLCVVEYHINQSGSADLEVNLARTVFLFAYLHLAVWELIIHRYICYLLSSMSRIVFVY